MHLVVLGTGNYLCLQWGEGVLIKLDSMALGSPLVGELSWQCVGVVLMENNWGMLNMPPTAMTIMHILFTNWSLQAMAGVFYLAHHHHPILLSNFIYCISGWAGWDN